MAVPLEFAVMVTPLGSVPESVTPGVGDPVVVTVKLPAVPSVNVVALALVMAGAWVAGAEQLGNLNDAIRVLQFHVPLVFRYSFVYQNVQSSTGSTLMEL